LEQLHLKTNGILDIISDIQGNMVQHSEEQLRKPSVSAHQKSQVKTGKEIYYGELSRPFDQAPAKVFLLKGCIARKQLDSSMTEFVSYLSSIIPGEDLLKYNQMLNTETLLPVGNPDNYKMSLMSALHSLEIMKNSLLTVESRVLNNITKH
jgi:hypothetical protein